MESAANSFDKYRNRERQQPLATNEFSAFIGPKLLAEIVAKDLYPTGLYHNKRHPGHEELNQ
jgi:hypothetical protein